MNTNNLQQFLNQVLPFLKRYGIFIAPVLLFLFFMFLLIFSYTSQPKRSATVTVSPTPSQTTVSSSPVSPEIITSNSPSESATSPGGGGGEGIDEKTLTTWSAYTLSDEDFSGLNATKTTLSDGSTEYTYDSDVPNRPNMMILKNGINVFQRTPFTQTAFSDNSNYYGTPDYIAKGSQFWGPNTVTYIYLAKGLALIGDTSNDQLFEQILFQPETIDQFKQQDTDMTGDPQKP